MYKRVFIIMVLMVILWPNTPATAQAQNRYFNETGHNLSGRFLDYWQQHGGLTQQGYPISEEQNETSDVDGATYSVQYFERAVLEKHPENKAPYDVLLTPLGKLAMSKFMGSNPTSEAQASSPGYFPETKHSVKGRFLEYWQGHGGLAQQGYPLTEEFDELSDTDGKAYRVQYFERSVFELHPENKAPNDVLLSLLGSNRYNSKYGQPQRAEANAGSSNPPASSGAPKDEQAYADYLAAKYNVIGTVPLSYNLKYGFKTGNTHAISLEVDVETAGALLKAEQVSARAWGESIYTNAKTNWPDEETSVSLSYSYYTYDPTFGTSDGCYYVGDFRSGKGYYVSVDFVQVYANAKTLKSREGVKVCHFLGGTK